MIGALEQRIGYTFRNKELLENALTHSSYLNELTIKRGESYERLEFLGDAVLEFIVSEYLFRQEHAFSEGKLTTYRASLVCEFTLSKISRELQLGTMIRFSKGEKKTGGPNRDSILCDVFESLLGAIYLDGGMEEAKRFVGTFLLRDIDEKQRFHDSKTTLQEYAQKQGNRPVYEQLAEEGPEHERTYRARVLLCDQVLAEGTGHSKKSAEQQAAYNALIALGVWNESENGK